MTTRTSQTHPLYLTLIDDSRPGNVSLTFAPGKHCTSAYGGCWERDLATDLDQLATHETGLLVCLVENHELRSLQIPTLVEDAIARGMQVLRLPIPDGGVLSDDAPVLELVQVIERAASAGINVVIHCRGGLGRAGTLGGCFLKYIGVADDEVFARLRRRHPTSCPETTAQRTFIRTFRGRLAPKAVAVMQPGDRANRFAGAVLGAAIGDAMGNPTEFMSMTSIHATWGPDGVTGFEKWWTRDGLRFAPYTDDTQMSEAVIRGLDDSRRRGLDLDATMTGIAQHFVEWSARPQGGHRAPGNACLAGCRALASGVAWREAGGPTAGGCGSVMRSWPFGLFFVDDIATAELWAVAHSQLTHRDPIALAACAAIARGIVLAVQGRAPAAIAADMVEAAARYSPPTSAMIQQAVDDANGGVTPAITLDRLRGWAAHEAIAAAVYVFLRHPDDPRQAILEGANTPGDSDSIASIAGALVGARCGLQAIPPDWVRDIERRDVLLDLAAMPRS